MTTRTVVAVLVGLGATLPLTGIAWAALAAKARITLLQHQGPDSKKNRTSPVRVIEAVARDEGIPVGGLGVLLAAPQIIGQAVLRQFKGPVLLAAAGLIACAIGGIWSL